MTPDLLVDDTGASLYGSCSHCQRTVDNYDDLHRVTPIMRGGRGVECVLRGDIAPHEAAPLGRDRPAIEGDLWADVKQAAYEAKQRKMGGKG